ncbi:MAG: hydrogenase maturation nickel metallochaperone HypA [Phycisphaerales bacterium]|nr:hydrogenase maturation nickel metallochaperone HypA [Phycisphaerales bacterium]
MHEAAITQALIEQVRAAMPPGARLQRCAVQVGELEHLDPYVMQTIWQASTANTDLRGAELVIERVALRVRCGACAREFTPADRSIMLCPSCGSVKPQLLSGTGIILRSLEVERT